MPEYINKFKSPVYIEETIMDSDGNTIGTIRIKPSGLLWKPSGSPKYYSVPLADFIDWIMDKNTRTKRTSS